MSSSQEQQQLLDHFGKSGVQPTKEEMDWMLAAHRKGYCTQEVMDKLDFVEANCISVANLEKYVQQHKQQAATITNMWDSHAKYHPMMAKGLLNALNAASVTHAHDYARHELQEKQTEKALVEEVHRSAKSSDCSDDDQFINRDECNMVNEDRVLGAGNGLKSKIEKAKQRKDASEKMKHEVQATLEKQSPEILKSVAPDVISTALQYDNLFDALNPNTMRSIDTAIAALRETIKTPRKEQPPSPHYPNVTDPSDPGFVIGLMKEAGNSKVQLDDFMKTLVAKKGSGATAKFAPLKGIDRMMVKVYEKYKWCVNDPAEQVHFKVHCDLVCDFLTSKMCVC